MQTVAGREAMGSRRSAWAVARRVITFAFFLLVVGLLVHQARRIDWSEVWTAMQALPAAVLAGGALLAVASHTLYSTFDLFGRHLTHHGIDRAKVMLVTFISYAFNLNFGALVGGFAFRYRLYARLGLNAVTVTRILTLSMLTNWLGYFVLGGLVFLASTIEPPEGWDIGVTGLRVLGGALLLAATAYVAACAWAPRRRWLVRGHVVELPSGRLALLQLAVSTANWMLIACIVYVLLQQRIDYVAVLAVLLVAAVAGVVTHVPAGLGVLEAVFVTLLSHRLPAGELLGALLAYRALYYLGPLCVAALSYVLFETRVRRPRLRP